MTSEKDIITGTRKLGMTSNVDKSGKLISGIHSLQGNEMPEGSIIRRTSADEVDTGDLKSRSKTNKNNRSY